MPDLLDLKLSPNERDHVMRSHPGGFVDEEDAVRCGGW
jgi:hypothetical protein